MKRKFVRVMLFGALTLAVSTTVTSCKDYDDDVKGLQEQIDKITSTSPVSTVDMKAAIDAAKTELQGKVTALEALLADKASQTKLESEIARVEAALEAATGAAASDLATKLATLKNDLTLLIDAKADASVVTKLTERVVELEKMKETLSSLIDAEKKFKESGDISGYKNTGFDAFVNQSILDAIADSDPNNMGAIAFYVTQAVQTAMTTQATALNEKIGDLTGGTITSLEGFLEKIYKDIYGKDGEIRQQLDSLDDLLEAIDVYVGTGEGDYADYDAIIKQIDDTKKQLAALNLPTNITFDKAVKDIIKSELEKTTGIVALLETKLQQEIDALKGMIQSIVYVPEFADRTVKFNTLYAETSKTEVAKAAPVKAWETVISDSQVQAIFRVSPAAAVAEILKKGDGKFTITTDYQALTRATGDFFAITNIEAVANEPNLIKVTLDAGTAAKSYAIALTVVDKDAASKLNDISSDYFAAVKVDRYIQKVEYATAATGTTLINDDAKAKIDYKATEGDKKSDFMITTTSDEAGQIDSKEEAPATLQIPETPFSVAFALAEGVDNDKFVLSETGVLTVKTPNAEENLGKSCTVTSTATVTVGPNSAVYAAKNYSAVTIISEIKEYTLTESLVQEWNGNAMEYDIADADKKAILKLCSNATDFENLSLTATASEDGLAFAKKGDNATLVVNVPAGIVTAAAGVDLTATLKVSKILTVKVTGNTIVNYPAPKDYTLNNNTLSWNGTSADVLYVFGKDGNDKVNRITVSTDLKNLFTNYDAVSAAASAINTAIKIESDNKKVTINGTTLTVPTAYDGKPINVTVSVSCGDHSLYTKAIQMVTPQLNGAFAFREPTEEEKDKDMSLIVKEDVSSASNRAKTIDLTSTLSWKDVKEKAMWPTVDDKYFAGNATTTLGIYGLSVKYDFADAKDANNNYFTLNKVTGAFALTSATANLPQIVNNIVVKVKVIPVSKYWGDMSKEAKTLTVTVNKWSDN